MKEVTVTELKKMMDDGVDFQLIDVREPHEYEMANLNGELIPLATIMDHSERISRDRQVIIHCRSGQRSGVAIMELEKRYGFTNLANLKGGILAWARDIDPAMHVI